MRLKKNNYLKTQIKTLSLNNNWNIFTQTLLTIFHLQQQTQVSWLSIIMILKLLSMIQNIFFNIAADPYVETTATHFMQPPSKLAP